MQKLTLEDVKNLHEYELIRDAWRRDLIETKARRRVLLGDIMSVLFENRLTVLNQVQEMCRAERIVKPESVQHELDVYNELLPEAGELSATLLIEITKEHLIQPTLDRLLGLGNGTHLWLELNGRKVFARFLEGQSREDRLSAVQYVRFPVGTSESDSLALAAGDAAVVLHVDHAAYRASAVLPSGTRHEIARDLVSR